jgi:hypothetical protein
MKLSKEALQIRLAAARQMVGREFHNGQIESCDVRNGDVYVTVVCKKCGLKDHGVTVAKAGLALKNYPNTFVCQNGCTIAAETAAPKSEREMSADEYRRLVVEPEFRARTKPAAPVIDNEWRGRWASVYTAALRTGTEGDPLFPANLEGFMALPDGQRSSLEQWAAGIKAERDAAGL